MVQLFRVSGVIHSSEMVLSIEIVAMLNCMLDPWLYVIWFRENRMELLKLFCSWNAVSRRKIESMRIDMFVIVTQ